MEGLDPQVFIDGGATGIALALVILLGLILRFTYKLLTNHIAHSDIALQENARAMTRLVDVINTNTVATDKNTKVSERIEHVLNNR